MIDAYTIGINLALEDGVSEGIAVVRRNLATLDRAIAVTAAGLVALRRLGQEVSVVAPAVPRPVPIPRSATKAPPDVETLELASSLPSSRGSVAPAGPDPATQPATRKAAAPASSVVEAQLRPMQPTMLRGEPDTGLPPAMPPTYRSPTSPSPPAQPPLTAPELLDRPLTATTSAPRPKSVADFAPRLPDRRRPIIAGRLQPPPQIASIPIPSSPIPQPAGVPRVHEIPEVTKFAKLPTASSEIPIAPPAHFKVVPLPATVVPNAKVEVSSVAPLVHKRPATMSPEVGHDEFAEHPSGTNRSPPRARHRRDHYEAAQSHASGDIMLDGAHLGRWVSDSLARLSERPLSGSTGLDPRMAPNWPAMQGH